MALPVDDLIKLREEGYYPFVAIFTWTYQEDKEMMKRLGKGMDYYYGRGIHRDYTFNYYCTGARKLVVIGHTNSNKDLQRFSSRFILGTPIQAEIYHAVDVKELPDCVLP
jgi:hypothetical protein